MASANPIVVEANSGVFTADLFQSRRLRDEELVDRVRSGDRNAFEDLLKPHLKALHYLVRSIVGNESDAQDAVQESLICAFTKLYQLRSSRFFRAWLMRIAVNQARMKFRSLRARGWMESLDDIDAEDDHMKAVIERRLTDHRKSPWVNVERREIREQLGRALERLPRAHRQVFILREIHGLNVTETAAILSITVSMVKTNLRRARLRLQRAFSRNSGKSRLKSGCSGSTRGQSSSRRRRASPAGESIVQ